MARRTRRQVLKSTGFIGVAGVTATAGCLGDAGDDVDEVRIGTVHPVSGDLAYYGEISLTGFFSGLAYKHDVDPITSTAPGQYTMETDERTYQVFIEDSEFSADIAQQRATDLVVDEEVDILFGATSSDSTRRLIETVVPDANVPLMIAPAADADITSDPTYCNDLVYRTSEHNAMDARAGGEALAVTDDEIDTIAIFGADYSFGYSGARNYRLVFEDAGVDVLEERFVPVGYSEFDGLFDEAVDQGADAVVGVFTASTLPQFISSGFQFDVRILGAFSDLLTTQLVGQTIQREFGEDFTASDLNEARFGPFSTRYHWNQYDNEINDRFTEMHIKHYGSVPDLFSSGTFTAASAIVQAVDQAESLGPDDLTGELRGMSVEETPKGRGGYEFGLQNNQAQSAMSIAQPVPTAEEFADTWDAVIQPSEPLAQVSADDAMPPEDEIECDLR